MIRKDGFSGVWEGESVILYLRKHPLTLIWAWRYAALLLISGSIVLGFAWQLLPGFSLWLRLGLAILLALVGLIMWWEFMLWYYDIFVVTNWRLIDFAKRPFIFEKRDEAQLNRVQDIRVVYSNVIGVLLDFGDVYIQTAGTKGIIRFAQVPRPKSVQQQILRLVAEAQQRGTGGRPGGSPRPQRTATTTTVASTMPASSPRGASLPGSISVIKSGWRDYFYHIFRPKVDLPEGYSLWRKHWWRLMQATAVSGTVFNLSLMLCGVTLWQMGLGPWLGLPLLFLLGSGLWNLWNIMDYWNDIYIVTDDRIIDIEKVPLVYEDRREAPLRQIQDVHYVQPSLLHRLLDFGDVEVETAGRGGGFTFESVPHPAQVQAEIFRRLEAMRKRMAEEEEKRRKEEFKRLLEPYIAS